VRRRGPPPRSWVLGEFASPEQLLGAARGMRERGYAYLDAHAPFPVPGLSEALGLPKSKVPYLVGCFGLGGAALGFLMQWWCNGVDFPINVGGRPLLSAPSFIPITFECGVLAGALAAFFGVLALMRLPKPYHPVFEVDAFKTATLDRFWISVGFAPGDFGKKRALADLTRLGALQLATVVKEEEGLRE
jgi:Protein of unknown function (DUF3341)